MEEVMFFATFKMENSSEVQESVKMKITSDSTTRDFYEWVKECVSKFEETYKSVIVTNCKIIR